MDEKISEITLQLDLIPEEGNVANSLRYVTQNLDPEDPLKTGIDFPVGYESFLYGNKEVPIVDTEISFYVNGEKIPVNNAKMYEE